MIFLFLFLYLFYILSRSVPRSMDDLFTVRSSCKFLTIIAKCH